MSGYSCKTDAVELAGRLRSTIASILTDRRIESQELTKEFYPATANLFEEQLRCDDLANPPWRMEQIASSSLFLFRSEAARAGIGPEAFGTLGIAAGLDLQRQDAVSGYEWLRKNPELPDWVVVASLIGFAILVVAGLTAVTMPGASGLVVGLGVAGIVAGAALAVGTFVFVDRHRMDRNRLDSRNVKIPEVRSGLFAEFSATAREPATPWEELVSLQAASEEAAPDEIVEASRAKPHFLRWGYIDQRKVWPNRSSNDVFHFRGGAVVDGSLSCVEEVVYNAGGYDRFIPRVTKSEWIGRVPETGVRNKSGVASGLVSGRHGLSNRISAVQMQESLEQAGSQVRIGFDTYDRGRKRDLNRDLPARSTRGRVLADTAGEWILRRPQNPAAGTEQVVVSYKTTVDINTWLPDPIVSTAIPSDTREVFEDILAEIRKRCAPRK